MKKRFARGVSPGVLLVLLLSTVPAFAVDVTDELQSEDHAAWQMIEDTFDPLINICDGGCGETPLHGDRENMDQCISVYYSSDPKTGELMEVPYEARTPIATVEEDETIPYLIEKYHIYDEETGTLIEVPCRPARSFNMNTSVPVVIDYVYDEETGEWEEVIHTLDEDSTDLYLIDNDNRLKVANSTRFPYCTMVELMITHCDASGVYQDTRGSGVLVGDRTVLTAGYNVYSKDYGEAVKIQVTPGLYTKCLRSIFRRRFLCALYFVALQFPYLGVYKQPRRELGTVKNYAQKRIQGLGK